MRTPHDSYDYDFIRGIGGTAVTFLSLATSHMVAIEAWMRILSLAVGITVGLVTIWSLTRKK